MGNEQKIVEYWSEASKQDMMIISSVFIRKPIKDLLQNILI